MASIYGTQLCSYAHSFPVATKKIVFVKIINKCLNCYLEMWIHMTLAHTQTHTSQPDVQRKTTRDNCDFLILLDSIPCPKCLSMSCSAPARVSLLWYCRTSKEEKICSLQCKSSGEINISSIFAARTMHFLRLFWPYLCRLVSVHLCDISHNVEALLPRIVYANIVLVFRFAAHQHYHQH